MIVGTRTAFCGPHMMSPVPPWGEGARGACGGARAVGGGARHALMFPGNRVGDAVRGQVGITSIGARRVPRGAPGAAIAESLPVRLGAPRPARRVVRFHPLGAHVTSWRRCARVGVAPDIAARAFSSRVASSRIDAASCVRAASPQYPAARHGGSRTTSADAEGYLIAARWSLCSCSVARLTDPRWRPAPGSISLSSRCSIDLANAARTPHTRELAVQ